MRNHRHDLAKVSRFLIAAFFVSIQVGCSAFLTSNSQQKTPTVVVTPDTPVVVVSSPADGATVSGGTVTISGTCTTASGDVTISGSGIQSDVNTSCTSDAFTGNATLTAGDGDKTVTASQGNGSGTTTKTITLHRPCAENYVRIPANATLGSSAFCMAKYEMKLKTNAGAAVFDGTNGGVAVNVTQYVPDSRPDGVPWVRITQANAIAECATLGAGYHLATGREWAAMTRNLETVAANWDGGTPGTGLMFRGHSDGAISGTAVADGYAVSSTSLLSSGDGTNAYVGTGNASGDAFSSGGDQRRTFTLSTGEVIWDIAGNARDMIDIDGAGSTISYTGGGSSSYNDVFSAAATSFLSSIVLSGGGAFNTNWLQPATAGLDNTTNNTGRWYISSNARTGRIVTRGANFSSSNSPGIFAADFDADNNTLSSSAGFRCAK